MGQCSQLLVMKLATVENDVYEVDSKTFFMKDFQSNSEMTHLYI